MLVLLLLSAVDIRTMVVASTAVYITIAVSCCYSHCYYCMLMLLTPMMLLLLFLLLLFSIVEYANTVALLMLSLFYNFYLH